MRLPFLPTRPASYLCFVWGNVFHNYLKDRKKGIPKSRIGVCCRATGFSPTSTWRAPPLPKEGMVDGGQQWERCTDAGQPSCASLSPAFRQALNAVSSCLLASGCCPLLSPLATRVCLALTDRVPGLGVEPSPPQGYSYSFLSLPSSARGGQKKEKKNTKKTNKPPLHIMERKYFCQFLFFYNYVCKK